MSTSLPSMFLGLVVCATVLNSGVVQAEDRFRTRHEETLETFLGTFLTKEGLDERGLPLMLRLPDPLRDELFSALWQMRDEGVPERDCETVLLYILQNDPAAHYQGRAASYLSHSKSARVVDALVAALKHKDQYVRNRACSSLGRIGDRRASDAIIPLLDDPSHHCRDNAVVALGKLKAKQALPKIRELWEQAENQENHHYAEAFARLGDNSTALAACQALLESSDRSARGMGAQTLRLIDDKNSVVVLIMNQLPKEMRHELSDWKQHQVRDGQVMDRLGHTLAQKTGERFTADPAWWNTWWLANHKAYGVKIYATPGYFADLLKKYRAPRILPDNHIEPNYSTRLEVTEQGGDSKQRWSATVNGWRARLIPVRRKIDDEQFAYFTMLFQNVSDKALPTPDFQFDNCLRVENGIADQRAKVLRDKVMYARELGDIQPHEICTVVIRLTIPRHEARKQTQSALPNLGNPPDIIYREVTQADGHIGNECYLRVVHSGEGEHWQGKQIATPAIGFLFGD